MFIPNKFVATGIATSSAIRIKNKNNFLNNGVATIIFMKNYRKTKKTRIRLVCKYGYRSGSRLHVEKVLTPPQRPSKGGT